MPVLSPLAHKRIQRFDERVDSVLDRVRGNPTADRVMYAASALGDHSLIWFNENGTNRTSQSAPASSASTRCSWALRANGQR